MFMLYFYAPPRSGSGALRVTLVRHSVRPYVRPDYLTAIIYYTNRLRAMKLRWCNVHKIRMCHMSKVGHRDLLSHLGHILAQIPFRSVFLLIFNPET